MKELTEGLRLLKTHTTPSGRFVAKVYKDNEWEEHRVKFFKDGVHQKNGDYHTNDVGDAHSTAQLQLNRYEQSLKEEPREENMNGELEYLDESVKEVRSIIKSLGVPEENHPRYDPSTGKGRYPWYGTGYYNDKHKSGSRRIKIAGHAATAISKDKEGFENALRSHFGDRLSKVEYHKADKSSLLQTAKLDRVHIHLKEGLAEEGIQPHTVRKITGHSYGAQYKTDVDGNDITPTTKAIEHKPIEKRGRGRPRKDTGTSGGTWNFPPELKPKVFSASKEAKLATRKVFAKEDVDVVLERDGMMVRYFVVNEDEVLFTGRGINEDAALLMAERQIETFATDPESILDIAKKVATSNNK